MKFFKPEDFCGYSREITDHAGKISDMANTKLEREGKIVYATEEDNAWWGKEKLNVNPNYSKFIKNKAILINIEPIEKCAHPEEKVNKTLAPCGAVESYKCECGAWVKPKEFEEVE